MSSHCLRGVAIQRLSKGGPGRLVSRRLITRVGILLGRPHLSMARVTRRLRFPSRSCLARFFGGGANVSPGRFQRVGGFK